MWERKTWLVGIFLALPVSGVGIYRVGLLVSVYECRDVCAAFVLMFSFNIHTCV